jgi:Tol biopolymer transport system component
MAAMKRIAPLVVAALAACSSEAPAPPPAAPKPPPTAGAASQPSDAPAMDPAQHVVDGPMVPQRLGVRRVFMRQPKVTMIRDPVFFPDGQDVLFVAKQAGVAGLWRLAVDGSKPAELVMPTPMFDPNGPRNARNRQGWFIGTPRLFPDGKHAIFEGSPPNPFDKFGNVLGIAPIEGGIVKAAVIKGVQSARTPDVHPDGQTIVFASCDELRTAKLVGRDDQEVESTRLVQLPKNATAAPSVCTVHRPRWSPDGKRVVFEGIGRFVTDEFQKAHGVPEPVNSGDYVLEPWIVNADGTGLRRLLSDEAYKMIAGRLQTGGSRDPVFSPDGGRVAFAHGNSIAVVTADGKQARIIARHAIPSSQGDPLRVQFEEDDPAFSPDGKKVVSASKITDKDLAPPGLSVADLEAIDATPATPEVFIPVASKPMQPGDEKPPGDYH